MTRDRRLLAAGLLLAVLLALSGLRPYERGTWLMEVAPILIAGPVLVATCRRFPLTTFLYVLLFCHALILMVGGIFTYARVPLGFWVQDLLHLNRNPYDKLGHFAQGFVPALLAREVVLRTGAVSGKRMAGFVGICVAMTVSACYELVEWGAALALGQGADAFLGTQGDPWDTQSDMLYALIGSVVATLALARLHDRAMARLEKEKASP
jgi:putative membrane protein